MGKQFHIKHPLTGKTIVVSRDAYNALQEAEKVNKGKQQAVADNLKSVGSQLTHKYYTGEANEVEIAVKFDEKGRLNQFENPQVSINMEIDDKTREVAEQVLMQFIVAMNQALGKKSDEMEETIKDILGEKAA